MTAADRSVMFESGRHGGFTLLEVLVALTVLGFLMIGLSQGVRTGLSVWNIQARRVGDVAELASTARVLRMLLAGIPLAPVGKGNDGSPPVAIALNGTADRLSFVGVLPTGLGITRLADIAIELKDDRLVLSWTPHRRELEGIPQASSDAELLRGIAHLQFAYFGATAPGSPLDWQPQWDGPALPELIRVQLNFVKGDTRRWPDLIVAPQLAAPEG